MCYTQKSQRGSCRRLCSSLAPGHPPGLRQAWGELVIAGQLHLLGIEPAFRADPESLLELTPHPSLLPSKAPPGWALGGDLRGRPPRAGKRAPPAIVWAQTQPPSWLGGGLGRQEDAASQGSPCCQSGSYRAVLASCHGPLSSDSNTPAMRELLPRRHRPRARATWGRRTHGSFCISNAPHLLSDPLAQPSSRPTDAGEMPRWTPHPLGESGAWQMPCPPKAPAGQWHRLPPDALGSAGSAPRP